MRISDWSSDVCSSDLGLEAVTRISRRNIISTIDNRRSAEDSRIIGCMFRHLIWCFPEGADSSRAALRKFLVAQAMRHYQHVDVTLDQIGSSSCRVRVCQYV